VLVAVNLPHSVCRHSAVGADKVSQNAPGADFVIKLASVAAVTRNLRHSSVPRPDPA
jgi:hypothetical protein